MLGLDGAAHGAEGCGAYPDGVGHDAESDGAYPTNEAEVDVMYPDDVAIEVQSDVSAPVDVAIEADSESVGPVDVLHESEYDVADKEVGGAESGPDVVYPEFVAHEAELGNAESGNDAYNIELGGAESDDVTNDAEPKGTYPTEVTDDDGAAVPSDTRDSVVQVSVEEVTSLEVDCADIVVHGVELATGMIWISLSLDEVAAAADVESMLDRIEVTLACEFDGLVLVAHCQD